MLVVVSPAKKIDMSPVEAGPLTDPRFPQETKELAKAAGQLSQADLKKLMGISDNLAELNKSRFATFGTQERKAAMFAFAGDTYQGLDATSLEHDEITFAQQHLRILSGLYGLLRPLDTIEPYRLEMGSRLATARGKSLYEYWGSTLSRAQQRRKRNAEHTPDKLCFSRVFWSGGSIRSHVKNHNTCVYGRNGQRPQNRELLCEKGARSHGPIYHYTSPIRR